ncbi:hypothetical protein PsorP6_016676 [Peronosclerospora sorghi]|uniref:Uncharacterized protein n=1 Tax=Peronosclerospora sorghi TaxID=230839 RepID=A0ACC0VNI8_9STRA|nr:hypothetical protein PsorP6_016676 [Peronosclerospora sorghi]
MKALTHRLRGHRVNKGDDGYKTHEIERSFHGEDTTLDDPNKRKQRRVMDNRRERTASDDHRSLKPNASSCNMLLASTFVDSPSLMNLPSKLKEHRRNVLEHVPTNMKRLRQRQKQNLAKTPRLNVNNISPEALSGELMDTHGISRSDSTSNRISCVSAERQRAHTSLTRSVYSKPTFLSVEHEKPALLIDVRYSGWLSIKRGVLKVPDKRYFFIVHQRSELFACKDDISFNLWLASGHALDPSGVEDDVSRTGGLCPEVVGTVIRAEAESEQEKCTVGLKTFQMMIRSASKCSTLLCTAPSSEKVTQWLEALQEIQVTKRGETTEGQDDLRNTSKDCEIGPIISVAKMSRVYANGTLQYKPHAAEDDVASVASSPTSLTDSSPTSAVLEHAEYFGSAARLTTQLSRLHSGSSCSSMASGQSVASTSGNVLLFVPVAGSALTASAARMAKAREELDTLVAKGAKLPSRVMVDPVNGEAVAWRYGAPDYLLTDLAYVKGRVREQDTSPLASYVEECCQTFIMEATHKARYEQWHSVCQKTFYLQVNDGMRVPGRLIHENDMLGLLYLGDTEANMSDGHKEHEERQDPRAEFAEAFPDGFPMEVLQVFTQPPQCYFMWRHWGPFTGKFRGVKGDGSTVEVCGFGEMTVYASGIHSLRLFFKPADLLSSLRQATARVPRRVTVSSSSPSSKVASKRSKRAASTGGVPAIRKEAVLNPKTSEIIEGLANFTIEATKLHRKQTQ